MLHRLRRHHRLISLSLLVTLMVWLSAAIAGCLPSATQTGMAHSDMVVLGDTHSPPPEMGPAKPPCPGGDCPAMESSRDATGADGNAPRSEHRSLSAAAVPALPMLIAARPRHHKPAWFDTFLPKRSPTLRFYALRI